MSRANRRRSVVQLALGLERAVPVETAEMELAARARAREREALAARASAQAEDRQDLVGQLALAWSAEH